MLLVSVLLSVLQGLSVLGDVGFDNLPGEYCTLFNVREFGFATQQFQSKPKEIS